MKYIDLFAGIGGFHYGIDQACRRLEDERQAVLGIRTKESKGEHDTRTRLSFPERHFGLLGDGTRSADCVYSNEWDKYANSVYRRHYGECDNRDIRNVKASEIPDFDLLCGGFPCQSFSIAGKRGGFEDTRGTMFFEIARIIKEKRPRLLLLENVKGLLNHDQGRTFGTILSTLDELGYDAQWQVLNSKNFGVPQNRERVYIVGHLRGTPRPEVFPITGQSETLDKSIFIDESQWRREGKIREYQGTSPTLNTAKGGGHLPLASRTVRTSGRSSGLGKKQNWDTYDFDGVIRRLTPTECMRLQGFPDDWCDLGAEGETISDSQKYKMAGNAVTTNVVTAVMEKII